MNQLIFEIINKNQIIVVDLLPYIDFEDEFTLLKITIFNQQRIWDILSSAKGQSKKQIIIDEIELSKPSKISKERIFQAMIQFFWQQRFYLKKLLVNYSKELINLKDYFAIYNLPITSVAQLLAFLKIDESKDPGQLNDIDSEKPDQIMMNNIEAFDLSWKFQQLSHLHSVLRVAAFIQITIPEILLAIVLVNNEYRIIWEESLIERLKILNLFDKVNSQVKKYSETELIVTLLTNLLPINQQQQLNLQTQITQQFLNRNELTLLFQVSQNRNDQISKLIQQVFEQIRTYGEIPETKCYVPEVKQQEVSLEIQNRKKHQKADHVRYTLMSIYLWHSVQAQIPIPSFLPFLTHKSCANQFCVRSNRRFMHGLIQNPELSEFNKQTKIEQYYRKSSKMDLDSYAKHVLSQFQKPYKHLQQAKIYMLIQQIYDQRQRLSDQLHDIFHSKELKILIRNLKLRQNREQSGCYRKTSNLIFVLSKVFGPNDDVMEDLNQFVKSEDITNNNNAQLQNENGIFSAVKQQYFLNETNFFFSLEREQENNNNWLWQDSKFYNCQSDVEKLLRILLNYNKAYPTLLLYLRLNASKTELQINITSGFITFLNKNNYILNILAKVCKFNKASEHQLQNLSHININQLALDPKVQLQSYQSILLESIIQICKQVYTYYDVLKEVIKSQNFVQLVKDLKQVKQFDNINQLSEIIRHLRQMYRYIQKRQRKNCLQFEQNL